MFIVWITQFMVFCYSIPSWLRHSIKTYVWYFDSDHWLYLAGLMEKVPSQWQIRCITSASQSLKGAAVKDSHSPQAGCVLCIITFLAPEPSFLGLFICDPGHEVLYKYLCGDLFMRISRENMKTLYFTLTHYPVLLHSETAPQALAPTSESI